MTITVTKKPNTNVFSAFQNTAHTKNVYTSLYYKRNHRIEETDHKTKAKIAVGSLISTLLPMIYFAKKQTGLKSMADLLKIKYELKEVLALSSASIVGGVISGVIADKKSDKKRKVKEGVFQFMNAVIPTALVGGAMKLIEDNTKYQNSKPVKVAAIVTSIIAVMPLASLISNIINEQK